MSAYADGNEAGASASLRGPATTSVKASEPKPEASNGNLAADGYPENLDIPIRYIKGMEGDKVEARRRYVESLKWREAENVDNILNEPSPNFDIIKKYYPHFYYKHAKNGSLVYYEIPGKISLSKLRENGLDLDALCRHYIYITEFLWNELDKDPEGKLMTCMDLKGAKLAMFVGEVKEFMMRSAKMIGAHYPERSYKIFIVNAPWWFNTVWKFVSPFVHPNTKAKVKVHGGSFISALRELVDEENIPEAIGGQDPTPPLESTQEIALRQHVLKVLEENGMEMKAPK